MGNNINSITYEQSNNEVSELDKLYLQLGNNIGKKDENIHIKEILKYFVENNYGLNYDQIEAWWRKREQLFLNVDELIWSNPILFDDSLCKFNSGIEEMKNFVMTSNIRNKILKYLKKLNCIVDDEFSIIGNFNWEEYVGIRLQCYTNFIITFRKLQLKLLNDKNNDLELNKLLSNNNLLEGDVLFLIRKTLNNFGNLETCEKINEIILKKKLSNEYTETKPNLPFEQGISNHILNCITFPKSLDEIYKKNVSSNSEIVIFVRCILGYIWSYYKAALLSDESTCTEIFLNVDNLFPKEVLDTFTDKNTMLSLTETIKSLILNITFNSLISESQENYYLLEDLIEIILQFGNNILSSVCGNEKLINNYCIFESDKVINPNLDNKNLILKIFENMFVEDGIFFSIIKTCLIIISILTTGVNFLAKYGSNDPESYINLNETVKNQEINPKKRTYFSQEDIYIIKIIMRMVSKCIHLMQQLWKFCSLLSIEMNSFDYTNLIREELYCYGPMQFHSNPRNTFIVEYHEKHSPIGIVTDLRNQLDKALELEVLEKHKYYWKLLEVHNASHIIIIFDNNCSTENTDILEIFGSREKYISYKEINDFNFLRSKYTESLFGKLSGSKHTWPKKPIIYEGNTLLVVFRKSLRSLNQMSDNFWGFRIYFQCHYWVQVIEKKIHHDISDDPTKLQHREILTCNLKEVFIFSVAAVTSSLSFMLRGPKNSRIENDFAGILDSLLFVGGLSVDYNSNGQEYSYFFSKSKKSDEKLMNIGKKNSISYTDFNTFSKKLIYSKNSKNGCKLNSKIIQDKKINNDIFYRLLPNIDDIEYQIINNLQWGLIANFILSFSSIIHYNARKNHLALSTELINDKTFINVVRNDFIAAKIGNEKLSSVVRGYICCYLHHLGLYFNIFQLCENLMNLGVDLKKIIQLISESPLENNIQHINNHLLFEFTIKFVLKQEFCRPLLNIWTLGRKFRSWMILERHKAEIHQSEENKIDESINGFETSFDFLLKSINYKISLILNLIPFSGSKHPGICLKNNYNSNGKKECMQALFQKDLCNHFDINGSKYIYYSNRNISLVLESIIGFNKYESFLNKYQEEMPETSINIENNQDSNEDINLSILDDTELEQLNIDQVIKNICNGIDNLIKTPNHLKNTDYNECVENLIGINIVLGIRRIRAISRFEAFRILESLINDENSNEFLLTSLIKSIRSMGKETPYLFPINNNSEMETLGFCTPNHFYFPNEYYNKNKTNHTLEVHYSDYLVGCGKKIQKQVKDAFYKFLYSLINGKRVFPIGIEILKMSLFAYFSLKKTDSNDFFKTNFPAKILNLLTGCNKNCELGSECIPSVSITPYPIFLIYSIICLKCSVLENSVIRLSLIFSSFVGLSHSISISGQFKGQLTVRELWKICEIYFMGNILILTSKMNNSLKNIEITKIEQRIYLENIKYIFNRRNNVNSSIQSCKVIDDLFIQFFYIRESILSNIICRALESSNQILHLYCIKFLWKFLPLFSTEDFLKQYSDRLIPKQYLFRAEITGKLNYIECFEGYLEKIGQSLILFDSFETKESKIYPPALLINSSESGTVDLLNNQQGHSFDNTNRLISNHDDFYKYFIFLLRYIVLYSEKSEKIKQKIKLKRNSELVHYGFIKLLCEQIYKIPSLLDSLFSVYEHIRWEEVYKCIGTLAVIIEEYDFETYIGKLVYFQENQLIENKNKIWKVGMLISNNPLRKEYSILINECKSTQVKKYSYKSINILDKGNISFPVKFMISKLNFDIIKIIIRILEIVFQHLSNLNANIDNLEKYFSIIVEEHTAIISNFEKKKLIGLQIISMSMSFINILLKNNYISMLEFNNGRNIDQLIELLNILFKIGTINIPTINEKANGLSNIISIILSRRFIQHISHKDKFAVSSYYPIFKKSTQADILCNSPYRNIMLNLPTKWEIKNNCFYYKGESTLICNINDHLPQDIGKSAMFTANFGIPTSLSFYYFEFNFEFSNELPTNIKFKANSSFLNEFDLPFYISIGLYRDGCQKGISGSFGSYAYRSTGELIHSCNENEFSKFRVEDFNIGDTVGCGIDFLNQIAFFTKNGRIIRCENKKHTAMEKSPCNNKDCYSAFDNVMGHFKPAIWIEKSNPIFHENKYLIVNGNFGQELFKYEYINKLSFNNILSLENEELSIFRDNFGKFKLDNYGYHKYNELNEAELNRITMAFELQEIMSSINIPFSVYIHALENCEDNLDLSANWLLEHGFQDLGSTPMQNKSVTHPGSINGGKKTHMDEIEYINYADHFGEEHLIDRLISLRNEGTKCNSSEYSGLINNLIFSKSYGDLHSNKNIYFDISKYFLIFGPFGEKNLHRFKSCILNSSYSNTENIYNSLSSNIWFNSKYDFQGYEKEISLSEDLERELSNLSFQKFEKKPFSGTALSEEAKHISFFPGTIVGIVPDIKYWISGVEKNQYSGAENTLINKLGTIIDLNSSPKCRVIYFLRRLSKLTGVVWLCNKVTNSTLVQFFDYYSLVYYLVNLPSNFLIETNNNIRLSDEQMNISSRINVKSLQEYIEHIFLSEIHNRSGKTFFCGKLTQIFHLYFKSEFLKCIKSTRDTISGSLNQFKKYLITQCDNKNLNSLHNILQIFKLVFGRKGPKILDYFVPMYSKEEKEVFSIYYKNLINEEYMNGYIRFLKAISEKETIKFTDIILNEYISTIRTSVYSEVPIITIETSHPYECVMDKKYDISFKDCNFFFAIFDPLCEINFDNFSFLKIIINDSINGRKITLLKSNGRGLSGYKLFIPTNFFSVHLVTSQNNEMYGIKAHFIPIKYSLNDFKILENKNIHFSYVLLDMIFVNIGNNIDLSHVEKIVEILLSILFEIHIPKHIYKDRPITEEQLSSFIPRNQKFIPIQNSFVHIVQQLISIFIKYPRVTNRISQKSIVILDYLNVFSNIVYSMQMDQLHIVTNHGLNVNTKYCIMLQLHYLSFFYKNYDVIFSDNKKFSQESYFTDLINIPYSKLSLELQIQHNLIAELNLVLHDSNIKYYYTNKNSISKFPERKIFPLKKLNMNHKESISTFFLNGDLKTHKMLISGKKSIFSFCPWYNIISTSNISIPAFISSLTHMYSEKYETKNKNLSLKDLYRNTETDSYYLPELEKWNNHSCFYEPNTPLVLVEKLSEIQISITSAIIIIPFDSMNFNQNSNFSIDITQFIKEILEYMDGKLLLLAKNRLLWLNNQTLKNQLSHYSEPLKILNNPILINYSLKRVLTNEVIVSRSITYNYNDLVVLTNSALNDTQDRVKLLWDILAHLKNKGDSEFLPKNLSPWMEGWEDKFISSKVKDEDDSFDPRNYLEYLNIYWFKTIKKENMATYLKHNNKKANYNSLFESPSIQLMREFLVKSYSEGIFQMKYWPVFIGTIPICDLEVIDNNFNYPVNNRKKYIENELICDSNAFVSNLREMNAPCSISFWLFPINLDKYQYTFSISNNKKFENFTSKMNLDFETYNLSEKNISEYLNGDKKWKLIAYRGVTVSTISFWITELGNLGIIINSPNKNYPLNLILNNQTTHYHNQVVGTSFSSFIQNKSSAIEYQTTIIISNRKIIFDQWNHITVTIGSNKTEKFPNSRLDDSYTIKLYINGLFDESKNIPSANLPLLGGDLPWIIGYPDYLRTDNLPDKNVFQSFEDDSFVNSVPNIFLGQDIGSSKLLRYLGPNNKYLNLATGEPLFGLIANFIVIHFEWELENIHDYIKNTFDEILFQDQLDEVNSSENLLDNHSNSKIPKISSYSKFRNASKYSKSLLHVFSNNWKNKPIVSHFNNIWQHEYNNIKINLDKKIKTEEIRKEEMLNISIPKIRMHSNVLNRNKIRAKLDIIVLEKLEIIDYKESVKSNNQNKKNNSDLCSCKDSPIDTIIIISNHNFEDSVFVFRLKYLNNIFSDLALSKLKKELDTVFEKESRTSNYDSYSNSTNLNLLNILHDIYSSHQIIKKFENYGSFDNKNNNILFRKAKCNEYIEDEENLELEEFKSLQYKKISNQEMQEIIPSVNDYIVFLFNEIKLPEKIFPIPSDINQSLFEEKVGCTNCKVTVLNFLSICNTILKRISVLFVSIFSFIDVFSPRPSIFKYSWLEMIRKYLSLSLKEVLINLCLAITEDPKADGKIRVAINRTKSMLKNETKNLGDQFVLNSVFGQLYTILEKVPVYRFRCKKRPWYVIYEGEGGIDAGGIYRDLLSHICLELQSNRLPLFVVCPNSYGCGENQYFFVPNPSLGKKFIVYDNFDIEKDIYTNLQNISEKSEDKFRNSAGCIELIYDSLYRFIGRLMGISIRTQIPLNLDIPKIIWKIILGESISLRDLKQIDWYSVRFYEKLKQIEYDWEKANFDDKSNNKLILEEFYSLDLCWSCLNINGEVVELKLGGERLPVGIDEIGEYCRLFKEYKLEREFLHATNCIRKGITEIIPENVLELQTHEELEKLVCGNPSIDVELLKQHTKYTGYSSSDQIISWFWDIISEMSVLQQQMFLRFVWGRSRLPSKGAQWENNMEIVKVYAFENSIYVNETNIVESNRILEQNESGSSDGIRRNSANSRSEEFNGIECGLESNDNEQLGIELVNQTYLNEQSTLNIESGNRVFYGNREDHLLPTSHTCFFQLELPMYSSKEILKERLFYAITEGIAIDIDNIESDTIRE
ncbi:large protein with a SPRY domain and HECT domain [Cryptosporidium ubiquitum]|uniref:Large protein with a SPRY domain and HECT domain n=1 Tax=Cryptosporidium ubiquitum TaxID=857276 RepID=A0A1J4MK39_9CRYT|nr:large protein with a SPRY domain and HECT domain [Cryptosporidium ubiquitum]OII74634.1 large protein with a SPRY domain and HECT domain [Cryptosporidium ubiquitum]